MPRTIKTFGPPGFPSPKIVLVNDAGAVVESIDVAPSVEIAGEYSGPLTAPAGIYKVSFRNGTTEVGNFERVQIFGTTDENAIVRPTVNSFTTETPELPPGDNPAKEDTREGVVTGTEIGVVHLPPTNVVYPGYGYGANSNELVGTLDLATVPMPETEIEFTQGDDRLKADGRHFTFELGADFPDAADFDFVYTAQNDDLATIQKTPIGYTGAVGSQILELELTSDETNVPSGQYRHNIQAIRKSDGAVATSFYGWTTVKLAYS